MAPPKIQTYHCLCTSLLLSSTHTLSSLPRRSSPSSTSSSSSSPLSDSAIILPLPSTPPVSSLTLSTSSNSNPNTPHDEGVEDEQREGASLPAEGYTVLLGLIPDRKTTIIRKEDGFEKRILYRCSRCGLIVGYELQTPPAQVTGHIPSGGDIEMGGGANGSEKGKGTEKEGGGGYEGKVIYILPGGVMSTETMATGRKIGEEDVGFVGTGTGGGKGVAVFE
ncbi:hypothetical protein ONS95_012661 [Cadophora gregata]|uniref:uncharacterized protein n=1 Tax=Cadophora gregata TaxID=51156 RepID=UPI0026DC6528|nr:uncharacterized protein ONS95_012661 [Cadophora gregata]KAK0118373.1 hypothetical protein ONS95_012661 [Cadophora gregata]KAK0123442.1 hypothetical protein ONS96_010425 [Cadophora gregata f. sp. sojae]